MLSLSSYHPKDASMMNAFIGVYLFQMLALVGKVHLFGFGVGETCYDYDDKGWPLLQLKTDKKKSMCEQR